MRCLVCGMTVELGRGEEHIQVVHLRPINLTRPDILEHAQKVAQPLPVRQADITYINLREQVIYYSLENSELLIAFADVHGNIPWQEVVEWQILHEKGHLACRSLYDLPHSYQPYALVNAEDYFINTCLIPGKYWPVCLLNARCAAAIRTFYPVPEKWRDEYYYCTLATFLAYQAISFKDINFLKVPEAKLVDQLSRLFTRIQEARDIPGTIERLSAVFEEWPALQGSSRNN